MNSQAVTTPHLQFPMYYQEDKHNQGTLCLYLLGEHGYPFEYRKPSGECNVDLDLGWQRPGPWNYEFTKV